MSSQTKRTLLSLTGLGIFLLLAFGSEYSTNKNSSTSNNNNSNTAKEAPVKSKDITTFSNSKSSLSGKLEENYVDFSFDYPSQWKRDPAAGKGTSSNFVKVENETPGEITIENFAVGYCSGSLAQMPGLATKLSNQFESEGSFPEYKKVSEGPVKIAGLDGYQFRFTGHSSSTEVWGRVALLPGPTGGKGVILVMIGTSASPILHSVDDIGEKGELPIILNSFKLGS